MRQRDITIGVLACALVTAAPVHGQRRANAPVDTAALQRILVAEDARGTGPDGIAPIVDGLTSRDTLLRRVAVRAAGRLQRAELTPQLQDALRDPIVAVRVEAANAIVQSLNRVRRRAADSGQVTVRSALDALASALAAPQPPPVVDALTDALGRLPYGDSTDARRAERAIVRHAATSPGTGAVNGLYWLAQNRRTTGGLSAQGVAPLRVASRPPVPAVDRRVAVLALGLMNALDSATTLAAFGDADPQVRRNALSGARALSAAARESLARRALADSSPIVRIAAIATARLGSSTPDCAPIVHAVDDRDAYVALTAIDALATPCADRPAAAARLLGVLADSHRPVAEQAHALVALARIDGAAARAPMAGQAGAPAWQKRVAAARAAAQVGDTALLRRLAGDRDHNVREAAINGLSRMVGHGADSVYIAALNAPGYQVVLAADSALAGSRDPDVLPSLLDAFDRLSAQRRENARDPRVATLKRIAELGSAGSASRLMPYITDFDTTIAANAAALVSRWTGTAVAARPALLPIRPEPLAGVLLSRDIELHVTMAAANGGGVFTIRLFSDEAPAAAARMISLAREHYFDGHVFQRVEPDFVVQGGGPDASEYMGDAQFMRDELGRHPHLRGTLGISSRGRDTGDAQWFFNLVDNTRLDHEYTVFGEVVSGMDVVDRILEGDAIAHVEVTGAPRD